MDRKEAKRTSSPANCISGQCAIFHVSMTEFPAPVLTWCTVYTSLSITIDTIVYYNVNSNKVTRRKLTMSYVHVFPYLASSSHRMKMHATFLTLKIFYFLMPIIALAHVLRGFPLSCQCSSFHKEFEECKLLWGSVYASPLNNGNRYVKIISCYLSLISMCFFVSLPHIASQGWPEFSIIGAAMASSTMS